MSDLPCTQPGCTGTVVDGYCDVCGSPPGAAPVTGAPGTVPAGVDTAVSTSSRTSPQYA